MTADLFRVVIFVLFGFTLGETAWIVRQYVQVIHSLRRLLPLHITLVGGAFIGMEAEVVWNNMTRVGEPVSWHLPLNMLLFSMALAGLVIMRHHITRKADLSREISPLLADPDGMP